MYSCICRATATGKRVCRGPGCVCPWFLLPTQVAGTGPQNLAEAMRSSGRWFASSTSTGSIGCSSASASVPLAVCQRDKIIQFAHPPPFPSFFRYYLRGVPAWDWFFSFHFAPLASDFLAVSAALRPPTPFLIRGAPLPPLHQLLAVTPPKSRLLLPPAFRSAMQHPRNVALFPTSVEVDMNGCSEMQAHKAVALVPFMDMSALALLFDQCAADLDPGSLSRNQVGRILIFTARGHAHGLLGIAEAPTATSHPGVVCHAA